MIGSQGWGSEVNAGGTGWWCFSKGNCFKHFVFKRQIKFQLNCLKNKRQALCHIHMGYALKF